MIFLIWSSSIVDFGYWNESYLIYEYSSFGDNDSQNSIISVIFSDVFFADQHFPNPPTLYTSSPVHPQWKEH